MLNPKSLSTAVKLAHFSLASLDTAVKDFGNLTRYTLVSQGSFSHFFYNFLTNSSQRDSSAPAN